NRIELLVIIVVHPQRIGGRVKAHSVVGSSATEDEEVVPEWGRSCGIADVVDRLGPRLNVERVEDAVVVGVVTSKRATRGVHLELVGDELGRAAGNGEPIKAAGVVIAE